MCLGLLIALVVSYYTTITGWGVLLTYTRKMDLKLCSQNPQVGQIDLIGLLVLGDRGLIEEILYQLNPGITASPLFADRARFPALEFHPQGTCSLC